MGSRIGILKGWAKRLGLEFSEYLARIEAGLKWCTKCKTWKSTSEFSKDTTRYDKLNSSCNECRRVKVQIVTKGRPSQFKGKTHSPEAKAKMSAARIGNQNKRGKSLTKEQRDHISKRLRETMPKGEQCWWTWKGGVTPENVAARGSSEYADRRKAVFERDAYTCQHCGDKKGGNLIAHHIKSFADHPGLRFDVPNGITLCRSCHDRVHDKPNSTRKQRKAKKETRDSGQGMLF